jgi:hypothetical protein
MSKSGCSLGRKLILMSVLLSICGQLYCAFWGKFSALSPSLHMGKIRNVCKILVRKLEGRHHSEDLGKDRRTIRMDFRDRL